MDAVGCLRMRSKSIDAIKLSVHFGVTFLHKLVNFYIRVLREVTRTGCQLTANFGMRIAALRKKGEQT